MSEVAVSIDKVYKDFKLPHQRKDTIKSVFTGVFDKKNKQTRYESQHALDNISFDIKKGEFFGIVGRNGSGKSTLLKILAGIYQPTRGKVMVGGKLVPFIELGVGFNPELSGRQNVFLNGALLGFSKSEIENMYDDIVEFAEIERFMDQKLKNYSSGMQVRLAFSMAIRAEADVLLIDEVLAVGDADFQRKCFRYFKKLKKDEKTVVFVSHDMNAVREYCDRAAFIEKSKLIGVDKPEKIAKMYEQLLSPSSGDDSVGEEKKRWGDGLLSIDSAKTGVVDNKTVEFSMKVTTHKDCEDAVLGFVVRDSGGTSLIGTNTMLSGNKLPPMKAGDKREIKWSFQNVLPDGDYTITLAAQYDGGMTNGDWWEDALGFRVTRSQRTPYLIDPELKVSIKH